MFPPHIESTVRHAPTFQGKFLLPPNTHDSHPVVSINDLYVETRVLTQTKKGSPCVAGPEELLSGDTLMSLRRWVSVVHDYCPSRGQTGESIPYVLVNLLVLVETVDEDQVVFVGT